MNKPSLGKLINRAVQIAIKNTEITETEAIEIADFYPEWRPDVRYQNGTLMKWGENERGRAQLYVATRTVTSQAGQSPDVNTQSYRPMGISPNGVLFWIRPIDKADGYDPGVKVYHDGKEYTSVLEGKNTYEPGVDISDVVAWA